MNPLQQLQEAVTAMALGNPDTAVVPVTWFRKQVIEAQANEALAAWNVRVPGKVGLAAQVLLPSLRRAFANVPGPQYNVEIRLRIFDDPKVNNTNLTAEDVGLSMLRWLDGLTLEGITQLIADPERDALQPVYDFPGFVVYDSVLVGPLPQDQPVRTAPPEIVEDAPGQVRLWCNDGAAQIYFSLDANTAVQPGLASQLYRAPLTLPVGTVVQCLAWNPALLPSHVARGRIVES